MSEDVSEYIEGPLPHWASGYANGEFVLGSILPTKDGRITGNACIYGISIGHKGKALYHCITDAGNVARKNIEELNERFHPPKYIASETEILKRIQKLIEEML